MNGVSESVKKMELFSLPWKSADIEMHVPSGRHLLQPDDHPIKCKKNTNVTILEVEDFHNLLMSINK